MEDEVFVEATFGGAFRHSLSALVAVSAALLIPPPAFASADAG